MIDIKNLKVNFESKVLDSNKVIILPHKVADFDAIGSAIGLSLAVRKLDKNPVIIVDDKPGELDRGVTAIIKEAKEEYPIINKCKYLQEKEDTDLYVLTDVNKSERIALTEEVKSKNSIIIDHHATGETTVKSKHKYIDTKSSSASEIITRLLLNMKIKIPSTVANYLLAGIYLDTNRFKTKVNKYTFKMADKLTAFGANPNHVMDWFQEDFDSERRVQEIINSNRPIVFKFSALTANNEEIVTQKELAQALDNINAVADADFAIGRISDDTIKISARSKEKVNVDLVMKEFGGGGSDTSAGVAIKGDDVEEVRKKLELVLRPKYYKKDI